MNKTFVVIIGVALVVVAFLYMESSYPAYEPVITKDTQKTVVSSPKTAPTKPVATKSAPTVVVVPEIPRLVVFYTDQGFSPSIREIKKGEEVTFINNSNHGMRISSFQKTNVGYYPGFSQTKTVGRGEIFKFTFSELGSWNYQNLNYENHTGIVVVK